MDQAAANVDGKSKKPEHEQYYDYAVASSATYGRYNAYPLPGRTYMVKAGATF